MLPKLRLRGLTDALTVSHTSGVISFTPWFLLTRQEHQVVLFHYNKDIQEAQALFIYK